MESDNRSASEIESDILAESREWTAEQIAEYSQPLPPHEWSTYSAETITRQRVAAELQRGADPEPEPAAPVTGPWNSGNS